MPLRLWNAERVKLQLQWEPRDLWVGAFWRWNHPTAADGTVLHVFHLYLCVVPLLPLHLTVLWSVSRRAKP